MTTVVLSKNEGKVPDSVKTQDLIVAKTGSSEILLYHVSTLSLIGLQ